MSAGTSDTAAGLELLARMLTGRPELRLVATGSAWCFNWREGVIHAPPDELLELPEDLCRGLVAHEGAHAAITRIHQVVPRETHRRYASLLNAVEDCRIETWLATVMPGAAAWVRAFNDAVSAQLEGTAAPPIRAGQFILGLLERWWMGAERPMYEPEVHAALAAVDAPLRKAFSCIPDDARPSAASTLEHQRRMWRAMQEGVLEAFDALRDQDRAEGLPVDELLAALTSDRLPGLGHAGRERASVRHVAGKGSRGERARFGATTTAYEEAWSRVHSLADQASDALLRVLQPRRRLGWQRDQRSGVRVNLRRAMESVHDARAMDRLWLRPQVPNRHEPECALVIDVSSSMQGERIEAAFDALVLLLEATRRAGIPSSVWSFSWKCACELDARASLDDGTRLELGGLRDAAGHSTNLGAALAAVHEELAASPATDLFVFVLSDGDPSDPAATTEALARLREDGVHVIALGLGPETRKLAHFFDHALIDVAPADVAERLGDLLLGAIAA